MVVKIARVMKAATVADVCEKKKDDGLLSTAEEENNDGTGRNNAINPAVEHISIILGM